MEIHTILKRIFLMTKLSFYALVIQISIMQIVLATDLSKGQGTSNRYKTLAKVEVDLTSQRIQLKEAFQLLQNETGFNFVYSPAFIKEQGVIHLKGQTTLEDILTDIAQQTKLAFRRTNHTIMVYKPDKKQQSAIQETIIQNEKIISGRVTDADTNEPLIGVNVVVSGSNLGTITDVEGKYILEVPEETEELTYSFMGYETSNVNIENRSILDIELQFALNSLQEVVVTALGIERNQDNLGYAIQKVESKDINTVKDPNLINALSGKIAGVNITNVSGSVGGSSRIVIRGETSLTGDNQPLFIVDGVPIDNTPNTTYSGTAGTFVDYGNPASEINPEDIASISVLKGPNAAALYGARAANGVIIIKTKSGSDSNQMNVTISSSTSFENVLRFPDYQNQYGAGWYGSYKYINGTTYGGPSYDGWGWSWGPPLDQGLQITQFDSPRDIGNFRGADILNAPNDSEIIPTDWVSYPDNVRNFFETGVTLNNSVSLSNSFNLGSYRIGYTNFNQTGTVPNTDLNRNSISLNTNLDFTDNLSIQLSGNYIATRSNNRALLGYGAENILYNILFFGRDKNIESFKDYWQRGAEDIQQFDYRYGFSNNVYFQTHENLNGFERDRLIANIGLNYQLTPQLDLQINHAIDQYDEIRDQRKAFSTVGTSYSRWGSYRLEDVGFLESNSSFLLSYNPSSLDKFVISSSFGGNILYQNSTYVSNLAPGLNTPNIYSINNARFDVQSSQGISEKQINSLYGFINLAYDDYLFLDLTGRNDWSSTLPQENASYFYPSASLSVLISEFVELPNLFSALKLRASWAQVGLDANPYQLNQQFNINTPFRGYNRASSSNNISNQNLKPEINTGTEFGADVRLFNNRFGLNFTYYTNTSNNQILNIPVALSSGYSSAFINAGQISSRGIELVLDAKPIDNGDFSWNVLFNFSKDRTYVDELTDQLDVFSLPSLYVGIQAHVGERMGDIYGSDWLRNEDGQVIHNESGFGQIENGLRLGNYNPDWIGGLTNQLSYKGFQFRFLIDTKQGGKVWSRTANTGRGAGVLVESLTGRENGDNSYNVLYGEDEPEIGNGYIISPGVIDNGDGTYRENDVPITAFDYNTRLVTTSNLYNASFIKLREASLSYNLPTALLNKLPFREATIGVNGRNLLLFTDTPHIDPEVASFAGSRFVPGVEALNLPSTRSYGFNIMVKF